MRSLIVVAALAMAAPVFAADQPASEASVREMMELSKVKKLLDSAWSQLDSSTDMAVKNAMKGEPMTPEQQKTFDEMRGKMVAIFREELAWEKIEPIFVDVYTKTFTQKEIDGINKFYRSDAGQAMVAKLPQAMQATNAAMMERLQAIIPRLRDMQKQLIADLKAQEHAK